MRTYIVGYSFIKTCSLTGANKHFSSSQWNCIQQVKSSNNSMFKGMFDELKEVKYLKEVTDFKNVIM